METQNWKSPDPTQTVVPGPAVSVSPEFVKNAARKPHSQSTETDCIVIRPPGHFDARWSLKSTNPECSRRGGGESRDRDGKTCRVLSYEKGDRDSSFLKKKARIKN